MTDFSLMSHANMTWEDMLTLVVACTICVKRKMSCCRSAFPCKSLSVTSDLRTERLGTSLSGLFCKVIANLAWYSWNFLQYILTDMVRWLSWVGKDTGSMNPVKLLFCHKVYLLIVFLSFRDAFVNSYFYAFGQNPCLY